MRRSPRLRTKRGKCGYKLNHGTQVSKAEFSRNSYLLIKFLRTYLELNFIQTGQKCTIIGINSFMPLRKIWPLHPRERPGHERVELFLYSPSGPSWPLIGRSYTFTFTFTYLKYGFHFTHLRKNQNFSTVLRANFIY
jgi:hypothetical protein